MASQILRRCIIRRNIPLSSTIQYRTLFSSKNVIPDIYKNIIRHFPKHIEVAFAYGSGVFQQENASHASQNMIDFIFVVNDPVAWHRANIKKNPSHYSALKYMGARYVTRIQNRYSAHVYYNTLVQCEGRLIKYGVISTNHLITDLLDWDTLYVSGRLHKPVVMVRQTFNKELLEAMEINRSSAVHAALLQLPEQFNELAFYLKICSLSYDGDFRMTFGENREKVNNIVKPNLDKFREIYEPFLANEQHIVWDRSRGVIEQYPNHVTNAHHLNLLPKVVQEKLLIQRNRHGAAPDLEEILRTLSHSSFCGDYVTQSLKTIVRQSSLSQSFKSIFTAGFTRSVKYSWGKIGKMNRSLRLN